MLKKIWATAKTFIGLFADRSEYGQSADRKVHKYDNHGVRNSRSERGFSNYEYLAVSVIEQIASERSNIFRVWYPVALVCDSNDVHASKDRPDSQQLKHDPHVC